MKKLFAIAAACIIAVSASAQSWELGARLGSGFQAQAAYTFKNTNAIEARFGCNWYTIAETTADFQALYLWNIMDKKNGWFMQTGVGIGLGGRTSYLFYGAEGCIRVGYKFKGCPIKLALDWSPIFGQERVYAYDAQWGKEVSASQYFTRGLANVGVSCVFLF